MGELRDKTRNATQNAKGKMKEAAGSATGNRKLIAKGKTDQAKALAHSLRGKPKKGNDHAK